MLNKQIKSVIRHKHNGARQCMPAVLTIWEIETGGLPLPRSLRHLGNTKRLCLKYEILQTNPHKTIRGGKRDKGGLSQFAYRKDMNSPCEGSTLAFVMYSFFV